MKFAFALAFVSLVLLAVGCGEDDVVMDNAAQEEQIPLLEDETTLEGEEAELEKKEIELPEPDIPQPIEEVIGKLEQGMEEKDIELHLEAFWDDAGTRGDRLHVYKAKMIHSQSHQPSRMLNVPVTLTFIYSADRISFLVIQQRRICLSCHFHDNP